MADQDDREEPFFRAPRDAALVFFATVAIRILYFATAHGPAFSDPLIDADYNDAVADQVAHGGGFPAGPFWQPPLFPIVCAILYRIFGHSLFVPRAFNAIISGLAAALVLDLALRLGVRRAFALAAGAIVALYGPLIFYDGELLPTSLGTALGILAVWISIARPSSPERAGYAGVAVGLGALAVPPVGLLLPVVAWANAIPKPKLALISIVAAAFALMPTTAYNRARSGEWTLIATNGGLNLWLGNNADADAMQALRPGEQWEILREEPARAGARSPAAEDAYFVHKTFAACASSPLACLGGFAHKARLLAMSREIPRNEDLYLVRFQSPVLRALVFRVGSFAAPWALLFPLAAAGFVAAWKRGRDARVIALAAIALAAGPILFFVTGRYRAPLIPVGAVLASLGLEAFAAVDRRALVAAAIALISAVIPAHLPVDDVSFAADMQFAIAGRRERLGDDAGAVAHFDEALSLRPDFLEAHYNLGWLFLRHERDEDAADQFRNILRARPDHRRARVALGTALLTLHDVPAAEREFRTVLAQNPDDTDALVGLAEAAMFREDPAAASRFVDHAEAAGADPAQIMRLRAFVTQSPPAPSEDEDK